VSPLPASVRSMGLTLVSNRVYPHNKFAASHVLIHKGNATQPSPLKACEVPVI
jgi:hypothetical protein